MGSVFSGDHPGGEQHGTTENRNLASDPYNVPDPAHNRPVQRKPAGGFGKGGNTKASKHLELAEPARRTLENLRNQGLLDRIPDVDGDIYEIGDKNKSTYQGEFKNSSPHGKGIVHFPNGSYYAGDFVSGKGQGEGIYIYPSGQMYMGSFYNSMFEGRGQLRDEDPTTKSGMRYKGEFRQGMPHGNGEETYYRNGNLDASYEGQFQNGVKEGRGVYTWANKNTYEGRFSNNLMQGPGVLSNHDRVIFDGEFDRGMKTGPGVFRPNKYCSYRGNFVDDLIEGDGTLVWYNEHGNVTKCYEGPFRKSKMHGLGTLFYPSNQVARGNWINNHNTDLQNLTNDSSASNRIQEIVREQEQRMMKNSEISRRSNQELREQQSIRQSQRDRYEQERRRETNSPSLDRRDSDKQSQDSRLQVHNSDRNNSDRYNDQSGYRESDRQYS